MSEEVLGVIGNLEGKGRGRLTRKYALVFTSHELLVVKVGGTLGLVFTAFVGEAVGQSYGVSTITDVYNQIVGKRSNKVKDMKIQDVLDADKLNYAIPYADIEKLEFKKGGILSPRGRRLIIISTKKKKCWFRIVKENAFNDYVTLGKKILPKKVS